MIDEQRDVLAARAQRRRGDRDDVEAVEEVLAEAPGGDLGAQIAVGRGDDAHVGAARCRRRRGSYSPSCSTRRSFTCTDGRELADLVEEERAARGLARSARRACATRAGERAALVAEELALEDRLGDRRAVDGDERRPRARAVLVDVAREQLLAGAALAEDEHGRARGRGLRRDVEHAPQRRARARRSRACVSSLISLLQRAVLRDERLPLGRLAHALDDRHALERLLDEVVRALAHRLDRRLDRAVRGHHHDLGVGRDLLERARAARARVVPGIIRSVSTTWTRCVRTSSSAALAPSAVSTRMPSRWKIFSSDARFERLVVDDEDRGGVGAHLRLRLVRARVGIRRFVKHEDNLSCDRQIVNVAQNGNAGASSATAPGSKALPREVSRATG